MYSKNSEAMWTVRLADQIPCPSRKAVGTWMLQNWVFTTFEARHSQSWAFHGIHAASVDLADDANHRLGFQDTST